MTNSPFNHLFSNFLLVRLFLIVLFLGQTHCLQAVTDSTIKDSTVLELIAKLDTVQEDTLKAGILNDLAYEMFNSDPEGSRQKAQEALDLSKEVNFPSGVASSYNLLALYEEHVGNYLKAVEYYIDALTILEKEGNFKNATQMLHNLGNVYSLQKDYDKALKYFNQSLEYNREFGAHYDIALNLNEIGKIYNSKKDYEKALEYRKQALVEAKISGNPRAIAVISLNISSSLDFVEDFELVKKSFYEALDAFVKMGDKKGEAVVYNNLGAMYLENSMFAEAIDFLEISIEKTKAIKFKDLLAYNYGKINEACAGAGDYKRANEFALLLNELNQEMLNESKVQAIAELETKYQVEKKKRALLDQQNQIEKLEHDKQVRNYFLFGGATLVILLGLLIWGWFRNYKQTRAAEDTAIRHQLDLYVKEVELLKNQPKDLLQPEEKQTIPAGLSNLLSERELEVFNELANGKTNKEMADTLFVSVNTIKSHLKNIYEKLDVKNRTQAVKKVLEVEANP